MNSAWHKNDAVSFLPLENAPQGLVPAKQRFLTMSPIPALKGSPSDKCGALLGLSSSVFNQTSPCRSSFLKTVMFLFVCF